MGRFTKRWWFFVVAALLLEITNASNLKWVAASNGNVPGHAVIGGENFSGEPLYIARVQLRSGLTVGKMAPSYRVAHTSWGGVEHFNVNYEILTNPGWRSHLEWKKSSGYHAPPNAVVGGKDGGKTLHVGRFLYGDGHMICGKVVYDFGKAYFGYNDKEFESRSFYVLVEHSGWYMRGLSKRNEFPELPGVRQPKRAPILEQQDEEY